MVIIGQVSGLMVVFGLSLVILVLEGYTKKLMGSCITHLVANYIKDAYLRKIFTRSKKIRNLCSRHEKISFVPNTTQYTRDYNLHHDQAEISTESYNENLLKIPKHTLRI